MTHATSSDTLDAALREHQAGNLAEAESLYRQVLQHDPRQSDAFHLLGVLAYQAGRLEAALGLIRHAIEIQPSAQYFANLGLVLAALGQLDNAIAAYQDAIERQADFPEAFTNLGTALRQAGHLDRAIDAYRRAVALRPTFAEGHNNLALALCDRGELDDAIAAYRQAIFLYPGYAEARNNLGNALNRQGATEKAIACWREAISLKKNFPEALNNLGNAMKQLGRPGEAAAAFRQALALQPAMPEAHNNLGVVLAESGQAREAIEAYLQAIALNPAFAEARYNLAIALHGQGDTPSAIDACRAALELRPEWPQAWNNLGIWLQESGRPSDALRAIDRAIAVHREYAQAHNNRGSALRQLGRLRDAAASYRRAIELLPRDAEAYSNLGATLTQSGETEGAIAAFRQALALDPSLSQAHNNLGNLLKDQGELDKAIACYTRAVALNPADAAADSNRIYALYFHPGYDGAAIFSEHVRWRQRHADALRPKAPSFTRDRSAGRRLRIGYVSPDFRDHCQAMFTLPLLAHHRRDEFEIYGYCDVATPDAVTGRIREYTDEWRNIAGMPDDRVADLIAADKIDILVDLTVHMAHNRMRVFAQKPAPVQVTWLGYPGTSGLETMDYRLSDPYLDPPGEVEFYSERTMRLPDSFWCYDPLTAGPAVNDLAALRNGFITFGCLNNFCKINDQTLRAWARVLRATPASKFLLLAPGGAARQRVLSIFWDEGIDSSRIHFTGRLPRQAYLELYHQIDIGLDTFPYNGHTTSLDSCWMGVPVVTRKGITAVSRGGFSQLSNLGLTALATDSPEDFAHTAVALAHDLPRLEALRLTLRQRLEQSPLMDAARFARNIESAYRVMWATWATGNSESAKESPLKLSLHVPAAARKTPGVRQAS